MHSLKFLPHIVFTKSSGYQCSVYKFSLKAVSSRVINPLSTKLARDRTGRISALGFFCRDLAALGPYCQDLGPIFSQDGPRTWLIRYMYCTQRSHRAHALAIFILFPPKFSTANDPEPDYSPEDHTQHEEKKKCYLRSKKFQPSLKKTYPWLRFSEVKMHCGTVQTKTTN